MQIANLIYDTVFKYMMSDSRIAKSLLSAIIDEKIVGLFGFACTGARRYALGMEIAEAGIKGNYYVGRLVEYNYDALVEDCYAKGDMTYWCKWIGGLVGFNRYSTIKNCVAANDTIVYTTADVEVNRIAGFNNDVLINNYANAAMVVKNSNGNADIGTIGDTEVGADIDLASLKTLAFYSTADNWKNTTWNFGTVWNICDEATSPWLRWQEINCTVFVAVTDIEDIPTTATVGIPLTLTGTVVPSNASANSIVWKIVDAGTTNATITEENIFTVTDTGTVAFKSIIADGLAIGTLYTQNFEITVSNIAGIAETIKDNIKIFPNPTNNVLNFNHETAFEIIDIHDKVLLKSKNVVKSVNVSGLSAGVYFVKLTTETGISAQKIVKK